MYRGERFFRELVENLQEGIYFLDPERRVTYWNKAAEAISGYSRDEVVGKSCRDNILMHTDSCGVNLCRSQCPVAATLRDGKQREADVYLHHKEGHRVPVSVRVSAMRDENDNIIGAVESFNDRSHSLDLQKEIEILKEQALVDPVVEIGNRRYLEYGLKEIYNESSRLSWPFGAIFLDIDNFKEINDTYGHDVGDRVLRMVSRTMRQAVRSYDLVGRWGGEEFLVVVKHSSAEQLVRVAKKLAGLVRSTSITHGDDEILVTLSVGAAMVREDESAEMLMKRVDDLMYASKSRGRNCVTCDDAQ